MCLIPVDHLSNCVDRVYDDATRPSPDATTQIQSEIIEPDAQMVSKRKAWDEPERESTKKARQESAAQEDSDSELSSIDGDPAESFAKLKAEVHALQAKVQKLEESRETLEEERRGMVVSLCDAEKDRDELEKEVGRLKAEAKARKSGKPTLDSETVKRIEAKEKGKWEEKLGKAKAKQLEAEQDLKDAKAVHKEEMRQTKATYNAKLKELKTGHKAAEDELKSEHKDVQQKLRDDLKADYEGKLENIKEKYQESLRKKTTDLKKREDAAKAQSDAAKQREAEAEGKRKELAQKEKDLKPEALELNKKLKAEVSKQVDELRLFGSRMLDLQKETDLRDEMIDKLKEEKEKIMARKSAYKQGLLKAQDEVAEKEAAISKALQEARDIKTDVEKRLENQNRSWELQYSIAQAAKDDLVIEKRCSVALQSSNNARIAEIQMLRDEIQELKKQLGENKKIATARAVMESNRQDSIMSVDAAVQDDAPQTLDKGVCASQVNLSPAQPLLEPGRQDVQGAQGTFAGESLSIDAIDGDA